MRITKTSHLDYLFPFSKGDNFYVVISKMSYVNNAISKSTTFGKNLVYLIDLGNCKKYYTFFGVANAQYKQTSPRITVP